MNDPLIGRSERVEVDGLSVNVRRWGDPAGRPFLFLHSLGPAASAALLGPGVGPIAEAGYAVAAPDMPGFGKTPPVPFERYEAGALAGLVVSLADRLDWDRFVLAGHSWGGAVAAQVAGATPRRIEALILVDSGHIDYADTPGADLDQTLNQLTEKWEAARVHAKDAEDVAEQLELEPGDAVVEAVLEGLTDDGAGGLVSVTTGLSRASAMYHLARARTSETWTTIAASRIPTLLLLATRPEEARRVNDGAATRFSASIPHAEVQFVDDATHSLITDAREGFGTLVVEWLDSLR